MSMLTKIKECVYSVRTAEKNAVGIRLLKLRDVKPKNSDIAGLFSRKMHTPQREVVQGAARPLVTLSQKSNPAQLPTPPRLGMVGSPPTNKRFHP